ncbi:MAG TPA: hypothetical protein ENJ32_04820 [Crenotrichaceae bacterium]|nr:hypothetical protein [Crenotrichaceae bacterium]
MSTKTVKVEAHINGELPFNWSALMTIGVLMVVIGTMGIFWAPVYSIGVAMIFGAFLLAVGIVQVVSLFTAGETHWKGKLANIIIAIIYIIGGGFALFNPPAAATGLTLMLSVLFLGIGLTRITYAFKQKANGWAWLWPLVSGVIEIIIAIILMLEWPAFGIWVPGMFFALELLMNGWLLIATASTAKKLTSEIS